MIHEFGIGVPLPQFRKQVAGEVAEWLEAAGMIKRPAGTLLQHLDDNDAVVVYRNGPDIPESERAVAFMATSGRGKSVTGEVGITAEEGIMVKNPNVNINGVGVQMTRAMVAVEQLSGESDTQIAFATSPQSGATFRRCGGEVIDQDRIPAEWLEECSHCPHKSEAANNERRCCATIFNLTNITNDH